MRVLVVHNRYKSTAPSGENLAVDEDTRLLRQHGHEVDEHIVTSDSIGEDQGVSKFEAARSALFSYSAMAAITRSLRRGRYDIMHVHNVYPLLSPAVLLAARDEDVAVVHTVHNQRHNCPAGTYFRNGELCVECRGLRTATPCLRHGCYRGSRAQSAVIVGSIRLHRRTWLRRVHAFIVLAPAASNELTLQGISRERIHVRPTFLPDVPTTEPSAIPGRPKSFTYLGRLEEAKGVRLLLAAWARTDRTFRSAFSLRIVGDGPLRKAVMVAAADDPSIVYEGRVAEDAIPGLLAHTTAVVVPSVSYEGFPRVIVEAFRSGVPSVVTSVGLLPSIVTRDVGWTAEATSGALRDVLTEVGASEAEQLARGRMARARYERDCHPAVAIANLINIYHAATEQRMREL